MLDIGHAYLALGASYLAVAIATRAHVYCKSRSRRKTLENIAHWLHGLLAAVCLVVAWAYLRH